MTLVVPSIRDPLSYIALASGQARGVGPALQRLGLWALSVPYGWGVGLRNRLYDRGWKKCVRVPVPVVSVGNLTAGGTGKTPCVEYIARFYRQRDCRVTILSRGYGSHGGPNDEALLLEENLPDVPHLQGTERAALAAIAVEELESEVLILDDGFQHRALARDLDLVLLDALQPWGFSYLLPRGLLREPTENLRRADVVLLTRCDQVSAESLQQLRQEVRRHAPGVPVVETVHRPMEWVDGAGQTRPLEALTGRPALAFCGIGNPDSFRRTLEALGLTLLDFRTFPDHHGYQRTDVADLHAWARRQPGAAVVLTTQKDLVKLRLPQLGGKELLALRIGLQIRRVYFLLQKKLEEALEGL